MATPLDSLAPLRAETPDLAGPLGEFLDRRRQGKFDQMAIEDRSRNIRRQSQQDQRQARQSDLQTQISEEQLEQLRNNPVTQKYREDTLVAKNLLDSGETEALQQHYQQMQQRYEGTEYGEGLQPDLEAIQAGDFERLGNILDAEIQSMQQMGLLNQQRQSEAPSAVREFQFFQGLTPEEQEQYLSTKRGTSPINLGDRAVIPSQTDPQRTRAEFQRGVSPDAQPELRGEQVAAEERARTEAQREAQRPQAEATQRRSQEKFDMVSGLIDEALDSANAWTTGMGGAVLSNIPGAPARDLKATVDTIRANVGFGQLQQMRDSSPTGGALGQVSEMENRLLQSLLGNLEQSQSEEQFRRNLELVRDQLQQIVHGEQARMDNTFNEQPQGRGQALGSQSEGGGVGRFQIEVIE